MPVYFSPRFTAVMIMALLTGCGVPETGAAQTAPDAEARAPTAPAPTLETRNNAFGKLGSPDMLNGNTSEIILDSSSGTDPIVIGHVDTEGVFRLLDPFPSLKMSGTEYTVDDIFRRDGRCQVGDYKHENGSAGMKRLSMFAEDTTFSAASSERVADAIFADRDLQPTDSYLEIFYMTDAATAKGQCIQDDGVIVDYAVELSPGLNILRTDIVTVGPDWDGIVQPLEMHITSQNAIPEDMQWYLSYSAH